MVIILLNDLLVTFTRIISGELKGWVVLL